MKKNTLLILILFSFKFSYSQEIDFDTAKKIYDKNRTEFNITNKDSIIKYNFNSKKKEVVSLSYKADVKSKRPHIGNYPASNLMEFSGLPKFKTSDISFIYRTRDLLNNINSFPSSAVTKIVKFKDGEETDGCTATFISDRFLITAAHCLVDDAGVNPDSLTLYTLYDNGNYDKKVMVKNIYYKKDFLPNSLDFDCYDIALIEIEEKLGNDLGYIGILSDLENEKQLNTSKKLYNFSYPHQSFASKLEKVLSTQPDSLRLSTLKEIELINYRTPDFNLKNQYLTVGHFNLDNLHSIFYKTPYAIAGQSGSSWISEDFYFYATTAMWVEQFGNLENDCRLKKEVLSSFIQIIEESN